MSRRPPRARTLLVLFTLIAALLCGGLVSLGNWQVRRLAWKRDLLTRVGSRIALPPVAPPPPAEWPLVSAARDEYRRVRVAGVLLYEREALVQAATELGSGYWVMTPLRMSDATLVWVNRGFVPPERRGRSTRAAAEPAGTVTITGLLRMPEPGGGFLRQNDAAADRWYSRDLLAMAQARGLAPVAPYFVDADAASARAWAGGPVGGLTVTAFSNNHLGYALTWYALAAMLAAATAGVVWFELRRPSVPAT